ncbi:nitrous oxide reductase accessory protein NosL [Flavobacterium channae]|uniref:nitrous oxide reductase accessory protein NosL n=1 Tax=Flavobacterium channae TaxID=2897181 RepID=UPI001E4118D9|nr:nitrous oxide reductase accessory protein NosL [Flavobacterium channae]UGS22450.1 nitrous oxide reductase accessory protein NosL [Flavobacterium channae]
MKKIVLLFSSIFIISCVSNEPNPIKLNVDNCDFCKMTISNGKFGAELLTKKGRYYKFDDLSCMLSYAKESKDVQVQSFFVNDYTKDNVLIPAEQTFYLRGGKINSPMRGNFAAFATDKEREDFQKQLNAEMLTWEQVFTMY